MCHRRHFVVGEVAGAPCARALGARRRKDRLPGNFQDLRKRTALAGISRRERTMNCTRGKCGATPSRACAQFPLIFLHLHLVTVV